MRRFIIAMCAATITTTTALGLCGSQGDVKAPAAITFRGDYGTAVPTATPPATLEPSPRCDLGPRPGCP